MDIQSFFRDCSGKWVSQRTTHHLIEHNNQSGRSDLWSEILEADHEAVVALCRQIDLDPSRAICGLSIRWSEVAEAYQSRFKPRNEGTVLLVPIAQSEGSTTGALVRHIEGSPPTVGTYSLGADNTLTLRFEATDLTSEERIWFASPNLRLRSSSIKQGETVGITTFCSEIRMNPPAETVAATIPATQSSNTP